MRSRSWFERDDTFPFVTLEGATATKIHVRYETVWMRGSIRRKDNRAKMPKGMTPCEEFEGFD
jgi:hypothetical protein